MKDLHQPLPDFTNPPVVEVALSIQFDRLTRLRTPQLGLLWQEFRERFPVTEEHGPLRQEVEQFGPPAPRRASARIEMLESPPTPRLWFLNSEGTELIQVQNDRFVHNWRKAGTDAVYPRYESVRSTFETELKRFKEFIDREQLGDFHPNQCEVAYVNHIVAGTSWKSHGELAQIIRPYSGRFSDDFLKASEDAALRLRFVIPDQEGQPIGRLHAVVEPGYRSSDNRLLFILNLTARGGPLGEGIEGVLSFLDVGREWVVRGFASLTTPTMHEEWGRKNGK